MTWWRTVYSCFLSPAFFSDFLCKYVWTLWRVKPGLDLARQSLGELPTRRLHDDGNERTTKVTDNVRVALVARSCFARLLMYRAPLIGGPQVSWVFVPAIAYHFRLNLPAAFTEPGARLLEEPCTTLALRARALFPCQQLWARRSTEAFLLPMFHALHYTFMESSRKIMLCE